MDPKVLEFAWTRPGIKKALLDHLDKTSFDRVIPVLVREASLWIRMAALAGVTFRRIKGSREYVEGISLYNCLRPVSTYTIELEVQS